MVATAADPAVDGDPAGGEVAGALPVSGGAFGDPPAPAPYTGRPRGGQRPPGRSMADTDIGRLREMHRAQVRIHREEQRAIEAMLCRRRPLNNLEIDKLRQGLILLTEPKLRTRLAEINRFLSQITRAHLDVARAHEKLVGSDDDSQLQAQLRVEFLRAAHTFTDEDWTLLDEVRRLQATEGHHAALLKSRRARRSPAVIEQPAEDPT